MTVISIYWRNRRIILHSDPIRLAGFLLCALLPAAFGQESGSRSRREQARLSGPPRKSAATDT